MHISKSYKFVSMQFLYKMNISTDIAKILYVALSANENCSFPTFISV